MEAHFSDNAFDTMSHEWIVQVLKALGFKNYFLNSIKVLLSNLKSFPIIDNRIHYDSEIFLKRGVRQGDPISGMLFIIGLQPLINRLKAEISDIEILAYADDLAILFYQTSQIDKILQIFTDFEKASGLSLNIQKSSFYSHLSLTEQNQSKSDFKYLGYNFNLSGINQNFPDLITKIRESFFHLKKFKFSYLQKALVTNVYVYPKVLYHLCATTPPETFFKEVEKLTRWFFSNSKVYSANKIYPLQMSMLRMAQPKDRGGFGLNLLQFKLLSMKVSTIMKMDKNGVAPHYQIHFGLNLPNNLKPSSPLFWIKKSSQNQHSFVNMCIPFFSKARLSVVEDKVVESPHSDLKSPLIYCGRKDSNVKPLNLTLDSSKNCYLALLDLNCPDLTETQKKWALTFNMVFSNIFSEIMKTKMRPHIKSFLIKLWNNAVFFPSPCPCNFSTDRHNAVEHFLFNCGISSTIFTHCGCDSGQLQNFFSFPVKNNLLSIGTMLFHCYKAFLKFHFDNVPIDAQIVKVSAAGELERTRAAFL